MEPRFIIQMRNGFFYESYDAEHGKVMVASMQQNAAMFPSRLAALTACMQSPEFAGAAIMPYEAATIQ